MNLRKCLGEVTSLRPYSVDTSKQLGKGLDVLIHTIFSMLNKESVAMYCKTNIDVIKPLVDKLRHCIQQCDLVLTVLL